MLQYFSTCITTYWDLGGIRSRGPLRIIYIGTLQCNAKFAKACNQICKLSNRFCDTSPGQAFMLASDHPNAQSGHPFNLPNSFDKYFDS